MSDVVKQIEEIQKEATKVVTEAKDLAAKAIKQVEDLEKKGAKTEDIDKYKSEIDGKVKTLSDQLDKLETERQKGLTEAGKSKSFGDQVEEILTQHKSDLSELRKNKNQTGIAFDVKAVGTQMIAGYNGGTGIGLTTWDNEMARAPQLTPFLRQIVRTRPIDGMFVAWAEKGAIEGGASTVAEGEKKPQQSTSFTEATKKVEKIAVFTKASKEALDDIKFLRSEINTDLVDAVELELDNQLLNGGGVSPDLSGILGYAPTINLAGTPFATGVEDPNTADILKVAQAIIATRGFVANYAILNPLDVAMLQLAKDANGQYILPPFTAANGTTIAGLRVIEKPQVAAGSFLVGDFNRSNLAIREEINVQIGYENDDFTRNLITILAEMRAVHYIKAQFIPAFVKGTIATVRTAMTAA